MPNILPALILVSIWCGSTLLAYLPIAMTEGLPLAYKMMAVLFSPIIFVFAFPTIAGLLSLPAQKGIKRGKFPREPMHPVYLLRRVYGAAWTQVYYFKPLYAVIIAIPFLKKYVLRLFGYKGSTNFVVYPDTWIRDLPILEVGEGAYLSNRSTIGTNICLNDGTIYVAKVKIQAKGMVGHLAMVAPGVTVSEGAEVGVGCAIGIHVRLGAGSITKPSCSLNHGVIVGNRVEIGPASYIGLRAEIGDGLILPTGSNIPAGAVLRVQSDVEKYYSSETKMLQEYRENVFSIAQKYVNEE